MDEPGYLLAEDLLLLLLDDERGVLVAKPSDADAGLAGALVVELALNGRVRVAEPGTSVGRGTVAVVDRTPFHDELLDFALDRAAGRTRAAADLVESLTPGLRRDVLERLRVRGILDHEEGRVLGVFARERWPAHDDRHELSLRARLRTVLVDGQEPDPRTGSLAALLHAVGEDTRALPFPGVSHRALRLRARALMADPRWASGASPNAPEVVREVTTAILAHGLADLTASPGGA